jgi:hypothetical protein
VRRKSFLRFEEIEEVDLEDAQNDVGGLQRKGAFAVENIMDMRLRKAREERQAALRELARADTLPEMIYEAALELQEVHP